MNLTNTTMMQAVNDLGAARMLLLNVVSGLCGESGEFAGAGRHSALNALIHIERAQCAVEQGMVPEDGVNE